MTEELGIVFIALLVGLFGAFAGYSLERNSWVSDCKALQVHRDGTHAYKCEQIKKETP
jgi:hypothetical protein